MSIATPVDSFRRRQRMILLDLKQIEQGLAAPDHRLSRAQAIYIANELDRLGTESFVIGEKAQMLARRIGKLAT